MVKYILGDIIVTISIILTSISPALAQTVNIDPPVNNHPIIISELQNNGEGTGTSNHEFIELYNQSVESIDLLGWKIIYQTASGSQSNLYEFTQSIIVLPDSFVIGMLNGYPTEFMPNITPDFIYNKGTTGLAATDAGIILVDNNSLEIDKLLWTSSESTDVNKVSKLLGGKSAQRHFLDDNLINDIDINQRFIVDSPTPRNFIKNQTTINEDLSEDIIEPEPDVLAIPQPNPKILLNELFIGPQSPLLDSIDEFVELYNPNDIAVDISGYTITAKTSAEYKHVVAKGTIIGPKSYISIKSQSSNITLPNGGASLELIDNLDALIDSTNYEDSLTGASWARLGDGWQWTTAVTEGSENVINTPQTTIKYTVPKLATTTVKKSANTSTKSNFAQNPPIKINELLPDPESPNSDSQDEFIELYNPNAFDLNISEYTINTGIDKVYKYKLPKGAVIKANSYYSVNSGESTISLNNNTGKVSLVDNNGKLIDEVNYQKAVPGSAWALIEGKWQWTTYPTKNLPNALVGLASLSSSNKATTVAGATDNNNDNTTPLVPAPQPLPSWILAVMGLIAICYAAYEYRFEVRNNYYKFRSYRSARQ